MAENKGTISLLNLVSFSCGNWYLIKEIKIVSKKSVEGNGIQKLYMMYIFWDYDVLNKRQMTRDCLLFSDIMISANKTDSNHSSPAGQCVKLKIGVKFKVLKQFTIHA